jgi:hypothetical protein
VRLHRVLVISVVALLFGSPAFAQNGHRVEQFAVDLGTWDIFEADCGDFQVWNRLSISIHGMVRVDKDGNPIQVLQHYRWSDSIHYNLNAPQNFLVGTETGINERFDFDGHLIYEAGIGMKVKVRGDGVIFNLIGRWIFDWSGNVIDHWGPYGYYEGDIGPLCSALRAPTR